MTWVAQCADSDWVAEQFAAIIAANWPAEPGLKPQRDTTVLVVRARRDHTRNGPRLRGRRLTQFRHRIGEPGRPHQRSPPRGGSGSHLRPPLRENPLRGNI